MDTIRMCKQCQQPLPADAPEGLCPQCLAKVALGSEPAGTGGTIHVNPLAEAATRTRVAPDVAQLAAQFPQLEIIELLGMGGMGMVYKARQPRLDRIVALKILPVESHQHPSFAERFGREAKALAKLNHPGIVNVYDFGQTGQYYYFVMEYVDGMNLRQLLNAGTVTPRQALELVVQICTALQYAHDEGVVHRDVKPENILLNKKGQVKIADFGLAKLLGTAPDTALTMSQAAMGTLNYMAPEQRENAQRVDHRADIYSLGVVFYELLTGEVPMGRFDAPSKKVQVDVRLDEVVLRALEREPERRYQQASEIKTNVEKISATLPSAAAPRAAPASAIRQPTFARAFFRHVLGISSLVWVAFLFLALKGHPLLPLSYFLLVSVPIIGLPTAIFEWRCEVARQGLRWKQLPPNVRRRGNRQMVAVTAPCAATLLVGMALFPLRSTEWREEWFYPKSHAYEKIGLTGNITSYHIPFWSTNSVAASATMAVKIYRKDSTPALLTFTLPDLRLEDDLRDSGQGPGVRVLNLDVLTNWLHDSVGLDVSLPQVQEEARQVMEVFEPYRYAAPSSWLELHNRARMGLHRFDSGEVKVNFGQGGLLGTLFFAWIVFPTVCLWLFYLLALPVFKRTFAEGRAEIEAGRWTPPSEVPKRFPTSIKTLFALVLGILFIGLVGLKGNPLGICELFLSSGIILAVVLHLYSRQRIQQARARGLWPALGEFPTLEHVKRLAQAGETILAIKLYRTIHRVSLADAKAAVGKLACHSMPPHKA